MKKVLFGIFAHPDDEAFGPSGTLYKFTQDGGDLHLILVTAGDAGKNDFGYEDLREVRLNEWQKSGALMNATSMFHLGYNDGQLCNNLYLEIAQKIIDSIESTLEKYSERIEVSFMTFDSNGISGHLDHIAVSYISTYVYLTLKENQLDNPIFTHLRYYCISNDYASQSNTNWLYMPAGYSDEQIDEKNDISDVHEQKILIMKAHESQKSDMEMILSRQQEAGTSTKECFRIYKNQ